MSKVIVPGPSLIEAASALTSKHRQQGVWPYQWQFPGPHSKPVHAMGNADLADATTATVVTYAVPSGMRFSLRALVFQIFGGSAATWVQGSGSLLWSLLVVSGGSRNVDNYTNVATALGSSFQPFPILGRLEFQSDDVLLMRFTNVSLSTVAGSKVNGQLIGHTYPNSEAA